MEKLCLRTEISCLPGEIKCSGTFFCPKKIDSQREHYISFPLVTRKMLLFTGKIEKAYLVRNFFCLPERRNSFHFLKVGAWRTVKTRACLLRFSALKGRLVHQ